jgi:23S rRNA pseudouridine2605 synthase
MARESADGSAAVRLQKFLSDAGVASRRRAEELILDGRVLVNDRVVDSLPAFVDPAHDIVVVNGARVRVQPHEYYLLHKPRGVVCTNRDPAGRPRAVDLLPPTPARLFPVGRLDEDSTGLLLMTNDGELAAQITHPRYGVPKVYRAEVAGFVEDDVPARMRAGVYLSDGRARAASVEVLHRGRERSLLAITLREGRNRQVRRMLARLGHPVRKLKRVQIGTLTIRGLAPGVVRRLTEGEVAALRRAVAQNVELAASRPPRRRNRGTPPRPTTGPERRRPVFRAAGSTIAAGRRRLVT